MLSEKTGQELLSACFNAALKRVDPYDMLINALSVKDSIVQLVHEDHALSYDLDKFDRIIVLGAGKAAAPMARAIESLLGARIDDSLVITKYGHLEQEHAPLSRIRIVQAAHPVPDNAGLQAAEDMLRIAESCDERTLVFFLLSGGGSALLPAPLPGLSLKDKQECTKLLLGSGADIKKVNTVRKHLSAIKGGRLAQALYPAQVLTLVLSDVIGDDLASIASGPCFPDASTWQDVRAILEEYQLSSKVPSAVRTLLKRVESLQNSDDCGLDHETPKPGNPIFANINHVILGSNRVALLAAQQEAEKHGVQTLLLSSMVQGEAREIAKFYAAIALEHLCYPEQRPQPLLVLAGGETTVTLKGAGKGGRSQEMALALFCELMGTCASREASVQFLAASTDGTDGPTDAAGALFIPSLVQRAREAFLDPKSFLANNDAYTFFNALGGLYHTGPTHTNVCDLQFLLLG
jgi:glycerate 2-kinase